MDSQKGEGIMKNKKFKVSMALTLFTLLLTSCGKENKVKSSSVGVGGTPYTSTFQPLQAAGINVPCQQQSGFMVSGQRFETTFYGGTPVSNTTIQGQFTKGRMGGTVGHTYYGVVPSTGDLVKVEKMVNGSTAIGFNVTLSLCAVYQQTAMGQVPLLSAERGIDQLYGGLILDDDTPCGVGNIDYSELSFMVGPYQQTWSQAYPISKMVATKVCNR